MKAHVGANANVNGDVKCECLATSYYELLHMQQETLEVKNGKYVDAFLLGTSVFILTSPVLRFTAASKMSFVSFTVNTCDGALVAGGGRNN
jgi:hypothetical protein